MLMNLEANEYTESEWPFKDDNIKRHLSTKQSTMMTIQVYANKVSYILSYKIPKQSKFVCVYSRELAKIK